MSKLVPPYGADSLKPLLLSEDGDRLAISGTRLREMFADGEPIPPEFSRAEVVAVLRKYYDSRERQ